jgi:hypothetical protein
MSILHENPKNFGRTLLGTKYVLDFSLQFFFPNIFYVYHPFVLDLL